MLVVKSEKNIDLKHSNCKPGSKLKKIEIPETSPQVIS